MVVLYIKVTSYRLEIVSHFGTKRFFCVFVNIYFVLMIITKFLTFFVAFCEKNGSFVLLI